MSNFEFHSKYKNGNAVEPYQSAICGALAGLPA